MKTLIQNGKVINVFTGEIQKTNVLLENEWIVGVGDYNAQDADTVIDVEGKYVSPGFIDGHIHIESTMLCPGELAKLCLKHGTTAIVSDPHEIANVCGVDGIRYMLEQSRDLPMHVYVTLPSCVPATGFDESGAVLTAEDLEPFYGEKYVLGLSEMMNYPGVIARDPAVMEKIKRAKERGVVVNGHAPLLQGHDLDSYISAGINDDHECSNMAEAAEKIRKGQWVMIREGGFARNLESLIDLMDEPFAHRCIMVTDDKHVVDFMETGEIDNMIRIAVRHGKSFVRAIQMATIQAATCLKIPDRGAIAPGYMADIVVFEDPEQIKVSQVFVNGELMIDGGELTAAAEVRTTITTDHLPGVMRVKVLAPEDFYIAEGKHRCRVIRTVPNEIITKQDVEEIDFDQNGGVDVQRDLLKIAVVERYTQADSKALGIIRGIGIKKGAIASTVSHDSHNMVIVGTNDADMAAAGNCLREMKGGCVAVMDGKVLGSVPLEIGGLMSTRPAAEVAASYEALLQTLSTMDLDGTHNPFVEMAFVCLPVIPDLKITTKGLVDVNRQELVPLFVED